MSKRIIETNPDFERDLPPINGEIEKKLRTAKVRIKSSSRNNLNSLKDSEFKRVLTFRSKTNKRFIGKYTKWLSIVHKIKHSKVQSLVRLYIAIYEKRSINRGSLKTCQELKELYSLSLRYASSHTFKPVSFLRCDKEGLPLIIRPFRPYLRGDSDKRKFVMNILQLYKLVETVNNEAEFTSITNKPRFKLMSDTIMKDCKPGYFFNHLLINDNMLTDSSKYILTLFINSWVNVLNRSFNVKSIDKRIKDLRTKSSLFVSAKNGPNGPAIGSITLDWISLVNDFALLEEESILFHVIRMSKLTRNTRLNDVIRNLHKVSGSIQIKRNSNGEKNKKQDVQLITHSRICLKQEVGGKVRPFAINDWFSQSVLSCIHEYLFEFLAKLPEDGSFSHNRVAQVVKTWTVVKPSNQLSVRSIDLTAATDRLVAQLQCEIMSAAFGNEIGYEWYKISTCRHFLLPDRSDYVKYSVGQPMGLLGSWANLALWHHLTVRACCDMIGIKYNDPDDIQYVIIGDDVAIKNPLVAKIYSRILEIIDLPTSKLKGYSEETLDMDLNVFPNNDFMHVAEIAKRVFINGTEITPVPPEAIKTSLENPSDFPSVLFNLEERGYNKLSETDVFELSKLCYKPKKSMLTATFPLSPCPQFKALNELFIDGEDLSNVMEELDVFWYKSDIHPLTLRRIFFIFIRGRLVSTFKEVDSLIDKFIKYDDIKRDHKFYETVNPYFPVIMKIIGDDSKKKFRKLVMGKDNPFLREALEIDLKSYIGKLFVLFDIKDALMGICNFKDQKRRTSDLIYNFSKFTEKNISYLKSVDFDSIDFNCLEKI